MADGGKEKLLLKERNRVSLPRELNSGYKADPLFDEIVAIVFCCFLMSLLKYKQLENELFFKWMEKIFFLKKSLSFAKRKNLKKKNAQKFHWLHLT